MPDGSWDAAVTVCIQANSGRPREGKVGVTLVPAERLAAPLGPSQVQTPPCSRGLNSIFSSSWEKNYSLYRTPHCSISRWGQKATVCHCLFVNKVLLSPSQLLFLTSFFFFFFFYNGRRPVRCWWGQDFNQKMANGAFNQPIIPSSKFQARLNASQGRKRNWQMHGNLGK